MAKINDTVRFLNLTGGGRVTKVKNNIVYVEDEDGFETPALMSEVVVVEAAKAAPTAYDRPAVPAPSKLRQPAPKPQPPAVEETPEGEELNIVLAYEADELKHLNTSKFYAYLVNDSNYYLYFAYLSRDDDSGQWHTRYHGIVEPNIQVLLEEFTHDTLPELDRVAIQYIAFKQGKDFRLKSPALVEQRLDTTRFYKLHCFHECPYFDAPVIALDIVKDDRPARARAIDSAQLEQAMRQKRHADRPATQPVRRPGAKAGEPEIVDLHIEALLDDTTGMDNAAMLQYQLDRAAQAMTEAAKRPGARVIFIHGKGEGVLRQALLQMLRRRWPRATTQDASFREYGFGATQVTVR